MQSYKDFFEDKDEFIRAFCDSIPSGLISGFVEENNQVFVVNERFLEMLGYTYEEYLAKTKGNMWERIYWENKQEVIEEIKRELQEKGRYEVEYRTQKKNGELIWVYDMGCRVFLKNGKALVSSTVIDISKNVKEREILKEEVLRDEMTGLYNRRGGRISITKALEHCSTYIFLMMDLDYFKEINDHYGHLEGDRTLKYIASELTRTFRQDDIVIRFGGDEFGVFLCNCRNRNVIESKLYRLQKRYQEQIRQKYPLCISGITFGGVKGEQNISYRDLYEKADRVLCDLKKSEKGSCKILPLEETL